MSLWSKIRGTIESAFQIGLAGPQIKNNSSVLEARNSADSGFVVVRGASPVAANDLVTKQYADTLSKPLIVANQFDGSTSLPSNSGTEQFYVVTTTGVNATIGQLVWDDGSGSGTAVVVATLEGRSIFTTQAFAGGTISLQANSYYVWDTVSTSWLLEANPAIGGAIREIRYAINNSATQDSSTLIPANAYVVDTRVEVTTPYSGGGTIAIGQSGSTTLLQATTDNLATVAGTYETPQDVSWGGTAKAVRTTVGGAPAAGVGVVIVQYCVPNA